MARGHLPIPFPPLYFEDLSQKTRYELERDFQAVQQAIDGISGGVSYFDALVDPTLAADDAAARLFTTIYAAVAYLAGTLGYVHSVVGVLPDRDSGSSTTITETSNLSSAGSQVTLIGLGGSQGIEGPLNSGPLIIWDLGDTTSPGSGLTWNIYNLQILRGSGTKQYLLGNGTALSNQAQLNLFDSHLSNVSNGLRVGNVFAKRTQFQHIRNFIGNETWLEQCVLLPNASAGTITIEIGSNSTGDTIVMRDVTFQVNSTGSATFTWQLRAEFAQLVNPRFEGTRRGTITATSTLTVIHVDSAFPATGASAELVDLDLSSATAMVYSWITGGWGAVTLPAPVARRAHLLDLMTHGNSDITGPAVGKIVGDAEDARLIVRGENNNLDIRLSGASSGATALLRTINMDNSILRYVAHNANASSTQSPLNIDSTSSRSVIIFEKQNITWGATTNSGAQVRVIDHDGDSFSGGGIAPNTYAEQLNVAMMLAHSAYDEV